MMMNFQDENEIQSLQRKTQLLEDKCEQLEMRLQTSLNKLHEASKVVDEFERYLSHENLLLK